MFLRPNHNRKKFNRNLIFSIFSIFGGYQSTPGVTNQPLGVTKKSWGHQWGSQKNMLTPGISRPYHILSP
eukprot:UN00943